MKVRKAIYDIVQKNGKVTTRELAEHLSVSRQYASRIVSELVDEGIVQKIGSTRLAFYMTPEYARRHPEDLPTTYSGTVVNNGIEEHVVLHEIEKKFAPLNTVPEHVKSIFDYAFSEMLNNAIDHSQTKKIQFKISTAGNKLTFSIRDFGIGVFRNVLQKKNLKSEIEAVQDILKGKTTTMPKLHSGEGIFFTSKVADTYTLNSYGYLLHVDNGIKDVFIERSPQSVKGTEVHFTIQKNVTRHLNDVFKAYTDTKEAGQFGFDKTEIVVKLYTLGGVHISRSQAKRITSGLEKFDVIVMDYNKIPTVGQAFADEIYRVFLHKYPHIEIQNKNMNEPVAFVIQRAISEARKKTNE